MVGQIVTKIAASADRNADLVLKALEGLGGQDIADALVLAIVRHVEDSIPEQHWEEVANGLAGAIIKNLSPPEAK